MYSMVYINKSMCQIAFLTIYRFFYWLPFNLLRLLLLLYFAADNKPRIQTEASALLSSCSSPVLALLLRSSAESETSICSFFVGIFLSPLSVEQAAFHSNQITESERPLHWAECKEVKKEAHVSAPPGRGAALPAAWPTSLTIRGCIARPTDGCKMPAYGLTTDYIVLGVTCPYVLVIPT